ncbi:MAG TPA: hypothetical protein VGI82_09350 [Chitinophagaceae bacterium]
MKLKKELILITLIPLLLLLYSCSGKGNSNVSKDSTFTSAPLAKNSSANSTGNGSFSCKIDGKEFSGKGSSSYANTAVVTSPGVINFVLVPMEKQQGVPPQFNFFVADHGTTTMHNSNSTDNGQYSAKYSPGGVDNTFGFKEVTVIITSSTASGIKGTFSGTVFDSQNKKEISVTDGKFDLPWSPYSKK